MTNQDRINELFEELVPMVGKADTVAGEIVRATCRIGFRWCNDGDRIGVEYGNETCNCAARYLAITCGYPVGDAVMFLWGHGEYLYDEALDRLYGRVLDYIVKHPELRSMENTCDMFDFDEPEDYEWDEEEGDDWSDDEDEYEDDYDDAEGWY